IVSPAPNLLISSINCSFWFRVESVFQLGEHTLRVPASLHALNRQRLVERLRSKKVSPNSVVLLQGCESATMYDTDIEPVFRQESYFHWAFGVLEPDWYGAIEVATGKSHLFMPKLPDDYATWMGKLHKPAFYNSKYATDATHYVDDVSVY